MGSSTWVKGEARTQWVQCRDEGPFPLLALMWKAEFIKFVLSFACIAKETLQFMLSKTGLRPNDLSWSNPCCTAFGPGFLLDHIMLPMGTLRHSDHPLRALLYFHVFEIM